jgi:uncharacterized protein (DUF849 family)
VLIIGCLNGKRVPGEHPCLPLTPGELAADAVAVRRAGAGAVHIHPRDVDGRESLVAADIGAAVSAIRAASPRLPVGVSTGLWIAGGDVARRQEAVRSWTRLPADSRPDFASVNLSEPGFSSVAETLLEAGIGVEAAVWSAWDALHLAKSGLAGRVLRILVEVLAPPPGEALFRASAIIDRLDELDLTPNRLLRGTGPGVWPLVAEAARLGLATRVGLEDTLLGPDGRSVQDNANLVRLAVDRKFSPPAREANPPTP